MQAITKSEAQAAFEAASSTAEAIVSAQLGFYEPTNRQCVTLYFRVFDIVLDKRLRDWSAPALMEYLYC